MLLSSVTGCAPRSSADDRISVMPSTQRWGWRGWRWGLDFILKSSALWLCLRTEDISASGHRMQLHVGTFRHVQQILSKYRIQGAFYKQSHPIPRVWVLSGSKYSIPILSSLLLHLAANDLSKQEIMCKILIVY